MSVYLEGGCFVRHMSEPEPVVNGTLLQRNVVDSQTGAQEISLRVLQFNKGISPGLQADADTVLYSLDRPDNLTCTVFIDGYASEIPPQTGLYVRPGQTLTVLNKADHPVLMISSQCPQSAKSLIVEPLTEAIGPLADQRFPSINLRNREAIPTADRWYRVLVDDELGSNQVTQFVGSIPPGRAPNHFHHYEEVLFILRGEGQMWAGDTKTPIGPGSCIYLPRRQVHCVENTGAGELRLLGVFYPAGSPAVRYEA
ncbi:MAG TPA: cupin domain-containing protein [Pyrinomonadaceae bacterium]|nr:cupin domain-containing protein [Pyrinomonadaceae bacterium]